MVQECNLSGDHASQSLRLRINDIPEQTFHLSHYHHDTWTILPKTRDKCLAQGLETYLFNCKAYLFEFDKLGARGAKEKIRRD